MLTTLILLSTVEAKADDRVIFGNDDRLDWYNVSDQNHLNWAKATAILVKRRNISSSLTLPTSTLRDQIGVCSREPFAQQPAPGFCSGFLVGDDIFVTAGHCIEDQSDCASTAMIFDYAVTRNGSTPDAVKRENIYTCQSIIARGDNNNDFAVLRLDRKVVNRLPMPIRRQGTIEAGEGLVLIGHPSGLPSKVAANAAVLGNSVKEYFTASTDSYQGNSGSAVFNAENGQIEGILVRGANDFVSDGGCKISARCTTSTCGGEGVTRVSVFARHIPLLTEPQPQPQPQSGDFLVTRQTNTSFNIPDNNTTG
ncbi:serine protease, partial [Dolichospermum sp. ST_sed1]|nr:serine protease [Dolichospermum sp. ST_sed1]